MRLPVLVLVVLLGTFQTALRGAESELWRAGISLIPYPRQVVVGGEDFAFGNEISILVDRTASSGDRFAATDLAARLKADFGIQARVGGPAGASTIILTRQGAPASLGSQGYEFAAEKGRVTVRAGSDAGLFYGTRTLLQVIQKCGSGFCVKGMRLTDWPDIASRAVHYDTKHHQDKAEYVREFIRTLADYKINMLVWEWEDKLAYRSHPEIGAPGAFTIDEMQELTRYARRYHVQIVPLVQGLGHVSFILKWPQHAHLREIAASNWQFCPRKEGAYKLLFDLWDEAIQATPGSEFIHIGTDETYELGQGIECGCRARLEEAGRHALAVEFVDRCARHLMAKGRQVMSWGGGFQPGQKIRAGARRGLIFRASRRRSRRTGAKKRVSGLDLRSQSGHRALVPAVLPSAEARGPGGRLPDRFARRPGRRGRIRRLRWNDIHVLGRQRSAQPGLDDALRSRRGAFLERSSSSAG
jgi:hexosaminidase